MIGLHGWLFVRRDVLYFYVPGHVRDDPQMVSASIGAWEACAMNKWQAVSRVAVAYRDRPLSGIVIVSIMVAPWASIIAIIMLR